MEEGEGHLLIGDCDGYLEVTLAKLKVQDTLVDGTEATLLNGKVQLRDKLAHRHLLLQMSGHLLQSARDSTFWHALDQTHQTRIKEEAQVLVDGLLMASFYVQVQMHFAHVEHLLIVSVAVAARAILLGLFFAIRCALQFDKHIFIDTGNENVPTHSPAPVGAKERFRVIAGEEACQEGYLLLLATVADGRTGM